jgi:hypothetical protein
MVDWFKRRQNPESQDPAVISDIPVINISEPNLEMMDILWQRFVSEGRDHIMTTPDRNSMRTKFIRIGERALVDVGTSQLYHYQLAGSRFATVMRPSSTEMQLISSVNPGVLNDAGILSFVQNRHAEQLDIWVNSFSTDYDRADDMGRVATVALFREALPGIRVESADLL